MFVKDLKNGLTIDLRKVWIDCPLYSYPCLRLTLLSKATSHTLIKVVCTFWRICVNAKRLV